MKRSSSGKGSFFFRETNNCYYEEKYLFLGGNIMITAIKDYNSMIIKPQIAWIKKHWVAYLVFTGTVYAVTYLWVYTKTVKNFCI